MWMSWGRFKVSSSPQENIYVAMCEGIYGGNPQVAFRFHTFNDRKHEGVNN